MRKTCPNCGGALMLDGAYESIIRCESCGFAELLRRYDYGTY